MSRKLKKGYFVKGQFVAEGSELDLEYKRELKGTDDATRTDLKRESTELQKLGEDLLTLRVELMTRLALPEKLTEAVAEAKRISNFEERVVGRLEAIVAGGKAANNRSDGVGANIGGRHGGAGVGDGAADHRRGV